LVTFTHAIASTSRTAPRTASSADRTPFVNASCSVPTMKPWPSDAQVGLENAATGDPAMASSSRAA
jgi:hypothetical protein